MQTKNAVSVNSHVFSDAKKLLIGYTQKPVFPFCGLLFIARFFNGIGLTEKLFDIIPHKPISPLAYNPGELLVGFVAATFCGMQRLSQYFRNIPRELVAQIMESSGAAAHFVTIGRVFKRIRNETELEQFREGVWNILHCFLKKLTLADDWLLFDSTVLTRYGNQEKAEKGYNPSKPGRKSHHPLISSLCEQGFILDIVNRPGKATASTGIEDAFARALSRMRQIGVKVLGVLADAGFYDETFLLKLEASCIAYIVVVRFYSNLKAKVLGLSDTAWKTLDDGIAIAEFSWKQLGWIKKRRYIVIRRDTGKCPDAVGKKLQRHEQLELPGLEQGSQYRYSCFVTSMSDEAVQVWRQYRRRILIERQIEDLTYELAFKKLNTKKWIETTAMLTMLMLAYNLYQLFAHTVLPKKDQRKKLSTIRTELFMVSGVIGRSGREQILRLSIKKRSMQHRFYYLFVQIKQAIERLGGNCLTITTSPIAETC